MTGFRSIFYAILSSAALVVSPLCKADTIYQAFDETFEALRMKLPKLKSFGYTYIQISPPQKSLNRPEWWARYQPVDLRVIEGPLGNEEELSRLIEDAHSQGVKVLVDVVLNHMADDPVQQSGLRYPEFGPQDFHYPDQRPCILNYLDRFQVTQYWLCDESRQRGLPDLDTSSNYVREVHKRYIEKLIDLGADGFRFDAMKHIEAPYWQFMTQIVKGKYYYGEVIGESFGESYEYTPYMPITDFHLLRALLGAFSLNGDLRSLTDPEGSGQALPADKAVVFARNHDTAMHRGFFNFGDYQDAMLANAYILARGRGVPSIYRDDWEVPSVRGGVLFHKAMRGTPTRVRQVNEVCENEYQCSPRTTLFIERGSEGFAMINSANSWVDTPTAKAPGLAPGCYKDLVYGVQMSVGQKSDGQKWITTWAKQGRQGLHIGPRSALMFVKSAEKDCRTNE
jgi:alpha-amylase